MDEFEPGTYCATADYSTNCATTTACLVTSLGRFIKDVDGSIERKTFIGMRIPGQKFRQDKAR